MCSGGDDSLYGVMDWLQENIENILQSHNIHQISTAARGRSYSPVRSAVCSAAAAVQWTVPVPCWTRWEQQQVCWLLYVSQPCNFNTELTTPPLLTSAISIPELKTVTQDLQLADDKKVMNEQSVGRFLLRDKSIDCEAE